MHKSHRRAPKPRVSKRRLELYHWAWVTQPYPAACCGLLLLQNVPPCHKLPAYLQRKLGVHAPPSQTTTGCQGGGVGEKAQAEISQQPPKLSFSQEKALPTVGCSVRVLSDLSLCFLSLFSRLNMPKVCFSQGSLSQWALLLLFYFHFIDFCLFLNYFLIFTFLRFWGLGSC